MSITKLLVIFVLLISSTAASDELPEGSLSETPMTGKTLRIKRSTLLVKDLQTSIDFYTQVVGLELYDIEDDYNTDPNS